MSTLKVFKVFSITAKYLQQSLKKGVDVELLKSAWAREIATLFNLHVQVHGKRPPLEGPCILVGNHISYLDIPILMQSYPAVTFISKNEVKHWPVIGIAAKKVKTIFVERGNRESRGVAKLMIAETLKSNNQQVAIFPSGTTCIHHSPFWKRGAFEIAKDHNIPVLPFRIRYEPLEKAAYVGDDTFLFHMLDLFKLPRINVIIEFNNPVSVSDIDHSCSTWKEWCESAF